MKRILLPIILILLFGATAPGVLGQTVGKIAGTVTDAASGDAIPSANVMVVGTTTGATTNIEGEFFILNIPVGTYDLKVTSLGYETQNIRGVQILADQTYDLKVRMTETVLQGQEVTVTAKRDIVKKEFTSTIRAVQGAEIEALPVATYREALARTAGAVGRGTNIHIRGGRRDEILYLVDGMEVKDPQFAQRPLEVSAGAIAEMQVMTAGFNAEYGEAQSAIVNLVTKDGDPQYHGTVEHVMDYKGISNYQDYDQTQATVSGPEPITQRVLPRLGVRVPGSVSLFGSGSVVSRNTNGVGTYVDTDRWYRHQVSDLFSSDVRKNNATTASNLKLAWDPKTKMKFSLGWNQSQGWDNPYWYRMSRRFPDDFSLDQQSRGVQNLSSVNGRSLNTHDYSQYFLQDFDGNGTLDPSDYAMADGDGDGRVDEEALNGQDDDGDGLVDEDVQFYEFNSNNSLRTDVSRDQQILATMNHTLSPRTFYTLKFSRYSADRVIAGGNRDAFKYGTASEEFVDLPDEAGAYNGLYDIGEPFTDRDGDGMYDFNNPANQYPNVDGFHIAGYGLAGNYQQLVPDWAHFRSSTTTLKFDLNSQVTLRHLLKSGVEYSYYDVATDDWPYSSINSAYQRQNYTDTYRYNPSSGAIYAQDKMEFRDIIINAGLRMDYWLVSGNRIQHPVADRDSTGNYVDYVPPDKNGTVYVSPRLGVAYSVTDRDVFHFNYGYFYQRGRLDYYFTGVNQQTGGTPIIGNPNLDPMKTIAYELGVRHQFGVDFLLDVSTYYKDIKNWIQTAAQNRLYYDLYGPSAVNSRSNASIYFNADYASVRGFEFNLSKDYGSHLSGRLTYTIAWATGKNSYDLGGDVARQNFINPTQETPLAWDRRHQVVINLGYNSPLEGKPLSEKWMLSGWSANLLSQALSGLPYTPTNANGTDVTGHEFSERSPWSYSTDVNLSRAFRAGGLSWRVLAEVRNLFDAVNVLGWDGNTYTLDTYNGGRPGYVNDPTSPNYDPPGPAPAKGPANPDAWDIRRLVRLGLSVEF